MEIISPIQNGTGVSDNFTMTGVKIGDILLSVDHISTGKFEPVGHNPTNQFRSVVVTDDVMQQNGGSAFADNEFVFRFLRINK